jgi:uncharacterized membrane protein YtjA (UPF0391 family)
LNAWAITSLLIAVVAAVIGFSGLAGSAGIFVWVCAVIGVVLAIALGATGRRPPE